MPSTNLIDMTGIRFGICTVISYTGDKKWLVRCDCGTEVIRAGADIRRGRGTKQCRHGVVGIPLRFWSHVKKSNTCWPWTAGLSSDGYGSFRAGKKVYLAHRWSWVSVNGPIEGHLELDHVCRNRLCVRIDHLEKVTHRENVLRGNMPSVVTARGYKVLDQ